MTAFDFLTCLIIL